MKITSIIFLILSVVLIGGGLFVCSYARGLAPNDEAIDGPKIEEGQIFDKIDYADQNVSRIALNLENCSVTIHGGAKSSYVELTNFETNKYIGSVTNKTLTVSNNISFSDYLNLDGSGVSFAGVWRTLRSFILADDTDNKTVDIYLSDDEDIKQLSLTVSGSDVKILDVSQKCDITLNATDSTVELSSLNFSTMTFDCKDTSLSMLRIGADAFNLEMNSGDLTLQSFTAHTMNLNIKDLDVNMNQTDAESYVVKLDNANLKLTTNYAVSSYSRSILLDEGEIVFNGESIGSSDFFEMDDLLGRIEVTGSGIIMIEFGDQPILLPETKPTTPVTGPITDPSTEPKTTAAESDD